MSEKRSSSPTKSDKWKAEGFKSKKEYDQWRIDNRVSRDDF